MTRDEALVILARFAAAWPRVDWTDDTVELWIHELAPIPADAGLAACVKLIRTENWPPPIAEFLDVARDERDRLAPQFAAIPETTGPPVSKAEALANIAAIRAELASARRSSSEKGTVETNVDS